MRPVRRTPDILKPWRALPRDLRVLSVSQPKPRMVENVRNCEQRVDLIVANDVSRADGGFDVERRGCAGQSTASNVLPQSKSASPGHPTADTCSFRVSLRRPAVTTYRQPFVPTAATNLDPTV
jgi:hypothetical protein